MLAKGFENLKIIDQLSNDGFLISSLTNGNFPIDSLTDNKIIFTLRTEDSYGNRFILYY